MNNTLFPKNGFSLLELLLTLSIIAIVSTISITALTSFRQKSQQDVFNSQLLRAIHLTRTEAILRHTKIILHTTAENWQGSLIITANEKTLYTLQTASTENNLHWRAFPLNRAQLEFLPSGLLNAENGTFWLCPMNAINPVWAIVLNQSGRARILYPNEQGEILDGKQKELSC